MQLRDRWAQRPRLTRAEPLVIAGAEAATARGSTTNRPPHSSAALGTTEMLLATLRPARRASARAAGHLEEQADLCRSSSFRLRSSPSRLTSCAGGKRASAGCGRFVRAAANEMARAVSALGQRIGEAKRSPLRVADAVSGGAASTPGGRTGRDQEEVMGATAAPEGLLP